MNKTGLLIRRFLSSLFLGGAAYLLYAVFLHPDRPELPALPFLTRQADIFFKLCFSKPIVSPSQVRMITSYLAGLGSRPAEGFASIVSFPHQQDWMIFNRRIVSWHAFNNQTGEAVIWNTSTCEEKKATTFIFAAGMGSTEGEAEVRVAGKPVVAFDIAPACRGHTWKNPPYELRFFPLSWEVKYAWIENGVFCLTVPESDVSPGQAMKIEVRSKGTTKQNSYFALLDFPDIYRFLTSI